MAPPTLRTWDRRYGLGPSGRVEGTHRRYTDDDVARLALMRRLVSQGIAPSEAARVALATATERLEPVPPAGSAVTDQSMSLLVSPMPAEGSPVGPAAPDELSAESVAQFAAELSAAGVPTPPAIVGSYTGDVFRTSVPPAASRPHSSAQGLALARALLALDAAAITDIVADSVGRQGVVGGWESLIAPALRAVGERWERQQRGVEMEHVFSECVQSVLRRRALDLGGDPTNVPPVLLSCAPEEQHSLPLHALAAALAERRVGCVVLGARVPMSALAAAVRRTRSVAVFVWSQVPETAAFDVSAMPAGGPPARVVTGGPGWDPARLPAGVVHVGEFARSVDMLVALAR